MSERKSKDNSVGKYDSAKQLFTSVTEILHAYPLVSTFRTSKENSNDFYDFDIFKESALVTDNNCIDDISSLNILNEVANLFILEVNDNVYEENLDLNTGGANKSSLKRKRSLVDTHPLLPPCNCKKKCIDNFPDAKRRKIHEEYWKISRSKEQEFIFQPTNQEGNENSK